MSQELPKVLVTAGPEAPVEGTVITTPAGSPDMEVAVSRWWVQVLVRVCRTYLQSLVAFLGVLTVGKPLAESVGIRLDAVDFWTLMLQAASLSVAPAVIALIHNAIELLAELDRSNPKLRG